jgi:drug/metabolite transporter (DMT)-like permease
MSNKKKFSAPLGASLVVLSSVFYASYGIWTKMMGNFFDGYTASALRSILVVFILIFVTLYYHKFEPLRFRKN